MKYLPTCSRIVRSTEYLTTHVAWYAAYTTERGTVRSTRPSRSTTALLHQCLQNDAFVQPNRRDRSAVSVITTRAACLASALSSVVETWERNLVGCWSGKVQIRGESLAQTWLLSSGVPATSRLSFFSFCCPLPTHGVGTPAVDLPVWHPRCD